MPIQTVGSALAAVPWAVSWEPTRLGALGTASDQVLVPAAAWCLVLGVVVFSGTLYAMALGGPRVLGAVTPIGGLALMVGWAWAACTLLSGREG